MIEIVIERSSNAEGETTFHWSVWEDDQKIETGKTTHFSTTECESTAVEFCQHTLGFRPEKVSRH